MRNLIMTVGLPRSGKSTWAQRTGQPVVSPDAIRMVVHGQPFRVEAEPMVWAIAQTMVAALFQAGHPVVILDATNITRARRDQWRDPRWQRRFQCFDIGADECAQRASRDQRADLLPVIGKMGNEWQPVEEDERLDGGG